MPLPLLMARGRAARLGSHGALADQLAQVVSSFAGGAVVQQGSGLYQTWCVLDSS